MPKQTLAEKLTYSLKIISLGLILGLGIQFAEAWTSPTLPPPSGTISGPITNGNVSQYKTGMLGVNSATIPVNALEVGGGGNILVGGSIYTVGSINATSGTVIGVLTAGKVQIVDVVTENSACGTGVVVGTVARDSNGVLLSCQGPGDLTWKKATGGGESGIGMGQTWHSYAGGERVKHTEYTNNTNKPIMVNIFPACPVQVGGCIDIIRVDGVTASQGYSSAGISHTELSAIVPPGSIYQFIWVDRDNSSIAGWSELR